MPTLDTQEWVLLGTSHVLCRCRKTIDRPTKKLRKSLPSLWYRLISDGWNYMISTLSLIDFLENQWHWYSAIKMNFMKQNFKMARHKRHCFTKGCGLITGSLNRRKSTLISRLNIFGLHDTHKTDLLAKGS